MSSETIDLRSDTVTQPSAAMRQAMAHAEVGDDVIDVDPTIDRLEKRTAEILGMEAAIYMPSGSMTNQIAIRIHCNPGDEFLCEEGCHIYNYEQAAFAQLSGVVARTVRGDGGILRRSDLEGLVRPVHDHLVRTRLVCLENTHNSSGGRVHSMEGLRQICEWATDHKLRRHLDGARLFNAVASTGIAAEAWASHFDTVSICFSKGLGAPVGSALAGTREFIQLARRHRKLFGGGMRQAGIIAAGALYGLEHNAERLVEDHAQAQRLGDAVRQAVGIKLASPQVESNMVIFEVEPSCGTALDFIALLNSRSVKALPMGNHRVRLVTHLDVSEEQIGLACNILGQVAEEFTGRHTSVS